MKKEDNPILETLLGAAAGSLAAFVTGRMLGRDEKARNPVRGSSITQTNMGIDEVLSYLKYSGYVLFDNYNTLPVAMSAAKSQEKQGYETKVVTVPVPLAKSPGSPYSNWVLRRRKVLRSKPRVVRINTINTRRKK